MTERLVWVNGVMVPEREARVSIYDSALLFGDLVFEMTRSFRKVQFKLDEHVARLFRSMKAVRIQIPYTEVELANAVRMAIRANEKMGVFAEDDEHRVMINVSRGLGSIYAGRVDNGFEAVGLSNGPLVMVAVFPLRWTVRGMGKLYDTGVNAVIPSQRAIPSHLMDPKIKHRSRLYLQLANLEVKRATHVVGDPDRNWPILLDPDGYVAEGTGYNVFAVQGGTVIGVTTAHQLEGISRSYVIDMARLGLRCATAKVDRYGLLQADEVFVTATPFCLMPVTSLDGQPIGDGTPGRVTYQLLSRWGNGVGVDIPAQIQAWDAQEI